MTDNIKLPPMPEWAKMDNLDCMSPSEIRTAINEFGREAVRLNAQAVPDEQAAFESYWKARLPGARQDGYLAAWDAWHSRAALSAAPHPAQAVPDGWALVPVEPTPKMIDAANLARKYREHGALTDPDVLNSRTYNSRQAYAAMLSAAPQPAQQPLTDEKDALLRQALEALEGFANITNDSQGVAGYHLSGNTAEWGEFPEVYHADKAIEAIRNHLGVKND